MHKLDEIAPSTPQAPAPRHLSDQQTTSETETSYSLEQDGRSRCCMAYPKKTRKDKQA